jgi:hypothetical protein
MASTHDNPATPPHPYNINNIFCYHTPSPDQVSKDFSLRENAKSLAQLVLDLTPRSREQSLALTKIEEATMWATAAVARNEPDVVTLEQMIS